MTCGAEMQQTIIMQQIILRLICSLTRGHEGEHYDESFSVAWPQVICS